MKAIFDGTAVRIGMEGRMLYEQSGYGRPEKDGIRLSPQEALYLIHRQKIEVKGYSFDTLLADFARQPNFLRSFLVYNDLRERGYVVQTGPHDFRVFKRGQKPGKGESLYLVRVLAEREPIRFSQLIKEVTSSGNMRKQYVLAIVDDEDELTYYEIKIHKLTSVAPPPALPSTRGLIVGAAIMVSVVENSAFERAWFGTRLDPDRLMLSPVEALYCMDTGSIILKNNGADLSGSEYFAIASDTDSELAPKVKVYTELRAHGYIPKTGYKYGHHFRVYSGEKPHSELLVHAVEQEVALHMSTISRSVRMAHSVKKKMLFGCVYSTGIHFIEFARIKL